jgi:hypothetical protein
MGNILYISTLILLYMMGSMVGAGAEGTTGGVQAGALLEAVLCYLYDIYGIGAGAEGATGGVQAGALLEAVLCHPHPVGLSPLPHHQHGQAC